MTLSRVLTCILAGCVPLAGSFSNADEISPANRPAAVITNVAQFKDLGVSEYGLGCDLRLAGVITFLDTNRDLVVIQDSTGAIALISPIDPGANAGEEVELSGSNASPGSLSFPDFPHRPALREIRPSFEAPLNGGDYHLTRMRGWVHPPVTGDYTFWIASDNSSELWLSSDDDSSKAKTIASVPRYCWMAPREWSKFPSQKSASIWLESGKSYYIEALQEQTHGDANLAVAWEGPGTAQSVISEERLTPWTRNPGAPIGTRGILFERWTNYTAGTLSGLAGARPFQSLLSVEELRIVRRGAGKFPKPRRMSSDAGWMAQNNYGWVEAEGIVTFASESGDHVQFELAGSGIQAQLRCAPGQTAAPKFTRDAKVRAEGVCEAFLDENGALIPGVIWLPGGARIDLQKAESAPSAVTSNSPADDSRQATALEGFYGTRGVVTFNGSVFGVECIFVQEANAAAFVKVAKFQNQLKVGDWVDLGGALEPGNFFPTIKPMVVVPLGSRAMPPPMTGAIDLPIPNSRDGRWTEIEGIGRSVTTKGTLLMMTAKQPVETWIGATEPRELARYIDAKLRLRGVLSATIFNTPILLVPSKSFVEVNHPAPQDPFTIARINIVDVKNRQVEAAGVHRVRIAGEVTLLDGRSFFVQDASGGIRALPIDNAPLKVGELVEIAGFPMNSGGTSMIENALVKTIPVADAPQSARAARLDLAETLPVHQDGSLVAISATLLAMQSIGNNQVLELQEGRRVFTATLATNLGQIPPIALGSRLELKGVCDTESTAPTGGPREKALASINLWLRSPADAKVLSGPPWWSWQRASALIGTLLAVLTAALLWVHLLRRRLERQKAAQIAASQQILKRLEEERRRIAANLHDSLGQVLLAIKNQTLVVLQRSSSDSAVRERLTEISTATSQAIDEVRQITHGLRPYQLDRLGLTQAMRATVSRASAGSPISFASRVEDIDGAFDKDSEIHVYRIVQEAINNILKHSAASEAAVVIKKHPDTISVSIRDNGQGFDFAALRASQANDLGYGLSGITERMRILGGRFLLESKPGEGTSLNLEIPKSPNGTGNHHFDR